MQEYYNLDDDHGETAFNSIDEHDEEIVGIVNQSTLCCIYLIPQILMAYSKIFHCWVMIFRHFQANYLHYCFYFGIAQGLW